VAAGQTQEPTVASKI
jgi:hypothetical protein